MNVLLVSSYPPMRCGIGAYAAQQAAALRGQGHVVDVFSLPGGDGDFQGELVGGWHVLSLGWRLWAYDAAWIHYTPAFFHRPDSAVSRLGTAGAFLLLALVFGARMRFVIHETDQPPDGGVGPPSLRRWVERWTWRRCRAVEFHSAHERDRFAHHYGIGPGCARLELVAHDRYFVPYAAATREQARAQLGVEGDAKVFVCIGFIQPHKGFDRVVRAMKRVDAPDARLYVVGSVRIDWAPAMEYAQALHRECDGDPRCRFIEAYVDDATFDLWLVAADYVVVPYHHIWSSGVAARARLHKRPMIVSQAGGLPEQMTEGSVSFGTDEELEAILAKLCA